jgi:cytoskeleton protein RodZ
MAEPLGQYFKRAREEKGWSLEQAAAKSRILPQYLQAVEEDNYERLPEEVFAKGFVRSYARLLGLGEAEVLQKFQETGGQFYAKRAEREQLRLQLREEERRKKSNQFIVAAMIGVALVVVLLATGRDRDNGKRLPEVPRQIPVPREPQTPAPAVSPPAKLESPAPAGTDSARPDASRSDSVSRESPPAPPRDAVPAAPKEPAKTAMPQPRASAESERSTTRESSTDGAVADNKKLVLDVEATERSWILVRADKNPAQDVLLSPGEHVRWSAANKLTLTLGNAGGVRILINGKAQGPYGTSGEVVKDLVFTR